MTTIDRVQRHTNEAVDRRIEQQTGARIRRCAGKPREIEHRLRALDREWDIECILETNASPLAFRRRARCLGESSFPVAAGCYDGLPVPARRPGPSVISEGDVLAGLLALNLERSKGN